METQAQIAADLAALPAHQREAARNYYARQAGIAAAESARAAVDVTTDALDSANPEFTGCTGTRPSPLMDSSCFRSDCAGEVYASLGWGDEVKAQIQIARG